MDGSKNLLSPDQAERIKESNRKSKENEQKYYKNVIEIFRFNDELIKTANKEYLSDDNEIDAKTAQKILRKILREYKTLPEKIRANSRNKNHHSTSSNEAALDELFISPTVFKISKEIEEHLHIQNMNNELKKIYGTFYGHVIGDAIGVAYEGQKSEVVKDRIRLERQTSDILSITGHPPLISPGQFTNDTELALTLARSLVLKNGYDKIAVSCSYAYLFTVTNPFTVHQTMENALICTALTDKKHVSYIHLREELNTEEKMQVYNEICKNVKEKNSQCLSNGSLMRISPLAIAFRNQSIEKIREKAKEDASLTHGNPIVGDATGTYCVAIAALLNGKTNEEAFKDAYDSAETHLIKEFLDDARIQATPVKVHPETYQTTQATTNGDDHFIAYLGVAFQSAFYELLHATSFSAGIERVILRGGDTDTNACIVGALLGARFGIDEIPYEWIKTVKAAPPSLLSYGNVRANLDLSFLSLKDFDALLYQLSSVFNTQM